MREDAVDAGARVTMTARLGQARIVLQVDIGFGDVITPAPVTIEYPTLLDLPAPRRAAFPRRGQLAASGNTLDPTIAALRDFLMPPVPALTRDESSARRWPTGGPWEPGT